MGLRQGPGWGKIAGAVRARDQVCRLLSQLSRDEYRSIKSRAQPWELLTFDVAHVFSVGHYPHLVDDLENMVLLNRFSHRCLDSSRSPITGDPISPEEVLEWWRRIVGEAVWERLYSRAKGPLSSS